jgi:2,4-dichlorophenol 6-monooxygenase
LSTEQETLSVSASNKNHDLEVPVLIVGGGACGLTTSLLLSDLDVAHLLVERHPSTSILPKAHYLNQRTMEVFRQHGLADAIYAVGTPAANMGKVRWCTSLGGDGPLDGKSFYTIDAFGGGKIAPTYARDSPCLSSNYPQIRLEPLLRRHAEQRAPDKLRFGHELMGFTQDEDGVTATIKDLAKDLTYSVRAQYLVGADGGKTVGAMLGIQTSGLSDVARIVSSHVTADLSPWWDESCLITWFINPEGSGAFGSGAMVPMGPTWGKHSEEWIIHFNFPAEGGDNINEETVKPWLRDLLKVPMPDLKVHKVSHWTLEAVLAERYRAGRVFLAGDAAHRHPPTTGLGLNTAVQDAHNLAWKLAAVVGGRAQRKLLESFETERQPIGRRNVDWAMFTAMNHAVLDAGMGFSPVQSPARRHATFETFFADTPMGATRRARAAEVFETQRVEFQAHDLEIGFCYDAGALVADGTPAPIPDPMGGKYQPSTRPGQRLPHAWLQRDGQRLSTHDLLGRNGAFVLITGNDGAAWQSAAGAVAQSLGINLVQVAIGAGQAYVDADGRWAEVKEISVQGALLVRPDNHVGWRSMGAAKDAQTQLETTLRAILAR